ncbi:glycosyltransferase [Mycolicibacterium neoaurum]|uniref:glycosyltransferase n=1 Tax=Mycolicibacterium neoaurum TaxID=1795 RepID=UPI002672C4B1|nr:glycosyltransferase [Mycolicibacterium neoaurum]MDO3400740.1 glycosyltransferase [Mycolicibacterium neoaurum]
MNASEATYPEVTVLLPVYNGSKFLSRQVESILCQEGVRVRLVLLDDGSTDDSLSLIQNLEAGDPRISVVAQSVNRGLLPAVYRLLSLVQTRYFAMSDQDDIWDTNKLADSVAALEETGAKLIYSDVRIVDSDEKLVESSYWTSRRIAPVNEDGALQLVYKNPIIGHTIVATADVARSVRPYPRGLLYYEVWLASTAMSLGSISYSRRQLGSYREHSTNVIGPQKVRAFAKICSKLGQPRKIYRRQQQRVAALAVLSNYSDMYSPLAVLYQQTLVVKAFNLPRVARQLGKNEGGIGKLSALKEILFYLLISTKRVDLCVG